MQTRQCHTQSPCGVVNRDQVPISLCPSYATTVDETGVEVVIDATYDDAAVKRFATLNLFVPMEPLVENGVILNDIKPHIVFRRPAGFLRGADFRGTADTDDDLERDQYHRGVVVSFQANAWVDSETNRFSLKECLVPVYETLSARGIKLVLFEDNLSAHKSPSVSSHFIENLN